uniref:UBN2 domain-containing protein n=1 Tax=Cajanus cajan TaxID=3821 RepID=A0A151SJN6_CAJCA|nr:hypothetical protein KK1_001240 [Cajanus cajan]
MFGRFQTIMNELKSLGTEFTKAQNNLKILDCFPKIWKPKTTTILEACDFKVLILDELVEALRVHDVHLNRKDHSKENATIDLKDGETSKRREKRKDLKVESKSSNSDENFKDSIDDEISLMSKKFKDLLKKKGRLRSFHKKKEKFKKPSQTNYKEVVCYECKKPTQYQNYGW